MKTTWHVGRVEKIETITEALKMFYIRIDSDEPFDFKSGQFVTLDLPVSEKRQQRWKSYSIANNSNEDNIVELCLSLYPDGLGSRYLFEEVTVGTEIKLKGPDGGFVLPEVLDKELIFLCTGTGVVPFRSMIQNVFQNHIPFKKIHLIYGTKTERDILFLEEFEKYAQQSPDFKFDICLSKAHHPKHHHGRIHEVYLDKYKEYDEDRVFYLCGWSQMIDEAVLHLFKELGYLRSQIVYELYG